MTMDMYEVKKKKTKMLTQMARMKFLLRVAKKDCALLLSGTTYEVN